jgi:sulfatase maturation enzyme AslB (radical SAM superfamily)
VSGVPLQSLADRQGDALVDGIKDLIRREKPMIVYLVGGEPLVRYRELDRLLPDLGASGLRVHIVTSAVRPIPATWAEIPGLTLNVSIDGLPPEHDERRKPATYERILKHIAGHRILVHCTVASQMMERDGYLEEFTRFWSARPEVKEVQFSLFTPQVGETSQEILSPEVRQRAVTELERLHRLFPALRLNHRMLEAFLKPPGRPDECAFARLTHTISADLESRIEPCQFGGTPDCTQCGCLATMGLEAVLNYRLKIGVPVRTFFDTSMAIGETVRRLRPARPPRPGAPPGIAPPPPAAAGESA